MTHGGHIGSGKTQYEKTGLLQSAVWLGRFQNETQLFIIWSKHDQYDLCNANNVSAADQVPISKAVDNRHILQIAQCTGPLSYNALFCNIIVHTCAHFCDEMVDYTVSV